MRRACAEIVLRSKVDVLALQEAGDREALTGFQESALGGAFPYLALSRGSRRGIYSAVLSRRPIVAYESLDLPLSTGAVLRRPLLRVDVDVAGTALRLYVVHLKSPRPFEAPPASASLDADAFRHAEAEAVAACLRTEPSEACVALLGDLNDEDGAGSTVAPLVHRAGLVDPVARELPLDERWTARWRRHGRRRFDYVLLSESLAGAYVAGSARVEHRDPAAYASDHRLVRLDLRLPRAQSGARDPASSEAR